MRVGIYIHDIVFIMNNQYKNHSKNLNAIPRMDIISIHNNIVYQICNLFRKKGP